MKKTSINNLDHLEKEIYRLRLEAGRMEKQMDKNCEYLKENFIPMAINTLFHKCPRKEKAGAGFFDSFFASDVFNKFRESVSRKVSDKFESLFDKVFDKMKQ